MARRRIYEDAAFKMVGIEQKDCCTSCHEDSYMGYDMSDIAINDEVYAEVCCSAARELSLKLYGTEDGYINVE